jgi:hypothetical protein
MTNQLHLFDPLLPAGPLSRRTDPASSYVAAAQYKAGGKFKTDKRSVLAALRLQGLPDLEREGLAERAGHDPQTKETLWAAT